MSLWYQNEALRRKGIYLGEQSEPSWKDGKKRHGRWFHEDCVAGAWYLALVRKQRPRPEPGKSRIARSLPVILFFQFDPAFLRSHNLPETVPSAGDTRAHGMFHTQTCNTIQRLTCIICLVHYCLLIFGLQHRANCSIHWVNLCSLNKSKESLL